MITSVIGPPAFASQVAAYLRHHRALGLRYRGVEHVLSLLGRHLAASGAPDLDSANYESWRRGRASLHSNSRRKGRADRTEILPLSQAIGRDGLRSE